MKKLLIIFLLIFAFLGNTSNVFAQTVSDSVNVDFSQQTANSSSSIFGVTQTPDDATSWNALQNMGVTFIRQDLALETFATSTNSSTWDMGSENYIVNKFLQAKEHNMKTMMIIDYTPTWLSFNGQTNGVPNNWNTWESIVKSALTYFKSQGALPDYYEIWNEPGDQYQDQFFDVTGSGMMKNQAYDLLYLHTWNAIKAVDTNGKIGGPADYQPESAVNNITYMLNDSQINQKIDFLSYHFYNQVHEYLIESSQFFGLLLGTPSIVPIKNLLAQMGRSNIPVMLSEYNYTCCSGSGTVGSKESVTWDAKNFIDMVTQGALAGGYFTGIDLVNQPEAHVFKLFSKDLGFGSGAAKAYKTTLTNFPNLNAVGAINANGQTVLAFSNRTANNENLTLNLSNTGFAGSYTGSIYLADLNTDPVNVSSNQNINFNNGNANFNLTIPAWSAEGIVLSKNGSGGNNADANNDGIVDGIDYVIWLNHEGQHTVSGRTVGDFNLDGVVDANDLTIWKNLFQNVVTISSPTPTATITASPTQTPSSGILGFNLISTDNGSIIQSVNSNQTFAASALTNATIQVNTSSNVKSVIWTTTNNYNSNKPIVTDNTNPFTIVCDGTGFWCPWNVGVGIYTINVNAYDGTNGTGNLQDSKILTITVN